MKWPLETKLQILKKRVDQGSESRSSVCPDSIQKTIRCKPRYSVLNRQLSIICTDRQIQQDPENLNHFVQTFPAHERRQDLDSGLLSLKKLCILRRLCSYADMVYHRDRCKKNNSGTPPCTGAVLRILIQLNWSQMLDAKCKALLRVFVSLPAIHAVGKQNAASEINAALLLRFCHFPMV